MNILEITTNVGCVNECVCCPQETLLSNYFGPRQMSLAGFNLFLSKVPYTVDIRFCGFSEPMLNPDWAKMMKSASKSEHSCSILTTLIGLRPSDIPTIQKANIHYIRFHLPDTVQFKHDEQRWVQLHDLFMQAMVPADYDYLTLGPLSPFMKEFTESLGVHVVQQKLQSRAGHAYPSESNNKGNILCRDNRWHYNVLLPSGDVYLCCSDWGLENKLGNLGTDDYSDIYCKGEELRLADHSHMICAKCDFGVQGHWSNPFGRPKPLTIH